jgi:hypothetical protein
MTKKTPKSNGSAAFGVNPKDDAAVKKPVVIVTTGGNETGMHGDYHDPSYPTIVPLKFAVKIQHGMLIIGM